LLGVQTQEIRMSKEYVFHFMLVDDLQSMNAVLPKKP